MMVHTDNTKSKQSLKKQALIELALFSKNDTTVKERREGERLGGREQGIEEGRRIGRREREKNYDGEQIKH